MHNDVNSQLYWSWFTVNEDSDDKVWVFKTAPIEMTDGFTWYTVVFYVGYI